MNRPEGVGVNAYQAVAQTKISLSAH